MKQRLPLTEYKSKQVTAYKHSMSLLYSHANFPSYRFVYTMKYTQFNNSCFLMINLCGRLIQMLHQGMPFLQSPAKATPLFSPPYPSMYSPPVINTPRETSPFQRHGIISSNKAKLFRIAAKFIMEPSAVVGEMVDHKEGMFVRDA